MAAKLLFSLRRSVWLLALLFITSALPAHAQYDDFDVEIQEGQFNFEYSNDLNGYIISPNKHSGWNWANQETQFLSIPSTRLKDGKHVVGLSGFGSLKYLDNIVFESPCHVKYICNNCFEDCTSLGSNEGLNLPESIETIGDDAFYGCTGLRSVNLSSNLKSIGRSAFEKCTSLQSITLPKSLKVIREFAFRNCANFDNWGNFDGGGLESVVFEDGVDFYTNGVYGFYNHVFWGCANLSSVKLPNGTPGRFIIPMGTFGYCGNLKSIEFPTNTGKIEAMAFYRTGLESLDLTKIEWKEPFYLQGYYTFAACKNLKTVTAKGKVRFDGLYTFEECTALETVTFTGSGDDYTVMNPDIFKRCSNLKSVKFYRLKGNNDPSNDMDSVFTDCPRLESVTSECPPEISKIGYSCFDGCTSLKTLSLPQTEFLINETAFRGCKALEEFDFTNVTSIGKGSFKGCTSLASTPNISAVTTIGEGSFEGCTGLTRLDFENLTSIGTKAFTDCSALKSINFISSSETPITVSIGSQAFTGCSVLETISFKTSSYNPPTVANEDAFDASHYATTVIDVPDEKFQDFVVNKLWSKFNNLKHPAMFAYKYDEATGTYSVRKGKYALESDFTDIVEIPATYNSADVVAIEAEGFQDLSFLPGVILHDKLTSIGAEAFYGCDKIITVVNKRATPIECDEYLFHTSTYTDGTLYVPFGSLDAYKNTLPWSKFTTIKQGFGNRIFDAPKASNESGVFNQSFDLTLTNPNVIGKIYYYIVPQSNVGVATENEVHDVYVYTGPIKISSSCTVVAYVSDGTNYCEPISLEFTRQYVGTENGLDKVLSANDNEEYIINTALYGHYHDGTYLYASTKGNSGSSKNTFNEDKKSEELSDKEADFNQEDWVAISGLSSHFVGKGIDSGYMATVVSNTDYPVISFNEGVLPEEGDMGINKFRVENFNIHAENAAVSDIWLVAPQAAEYCSVTGYLKAGNIHEAEEYFVLQSAESATSENETAVEPLTMNVYYDPASITLVGDRWCSFTGIVSKAGDALKFTALYNGEMSIANTNAELISMEAGNLYQVNVSLEGVMVNGGVLYARTSGPSASPSVPAETRTLIASEDSDRLDQYNQRDWVAIEGLSLDYVGFELGSFIAEYDGATLTSVASTPAVGTAVDVTNLNMFTVANVFYGNYENTESLALENGYRPFYVKAKVNEVAYYVGLVNLNEDGKYELWGEGEVGKLNDKGLEIDTNGVGFTTSTKKIEGVLVADTEANGGVKLVALSAKDIISGVETPEADGKAVIYGTKGAVVVAGADGKVTIFDAMGRKVKTVDANGVTTIQMPAGYYIVHTAETAKSVIVM